MAVPSNNNTMTTTVSTVVETDEADVVVDVMSDNHEQQPAVELETLAEGLLLLTRFASLDSATYQASIAFPRSSHSPTHTHENDHEEESKEEEISPEVEKHQQMLQRLELLQAQKNVQNTHLPALWRALHRLHSNLAILQENEAKHANEVRQLRDDLTNAVRDKSKLRKACKLLTEQNGLLKRKLNEKRALLKQARDVFRSSQELQKDLEQQNAAFKLQAHEQFLMQSSRMRLGSTDSNFSDADALLFPDTNLMSDHSGPLPISGGGGGGSGRTSTTLPEDEDLVSLHSANSSITDEGVPVLKLFTHNDDVMTSATAVNTIDSSHMSDMSVLSDENNLVVSMQLNEKSCNLPGGPLKHPASPRQPEAYKLWFPFGEKVALRFQTIPLAELPVPPKGVLTQEFLKGDDGAQHPPTIPEEEEETKQEKLKGHAFVVAAYENTAEGAEEQPRPTLGSRVMELNGQPVNAEWSLWQFLDALKLESGVAHRHHHRGSDSSNNKGQTDAKASTKSQDSNAAATADEEESAASSAEEKKKHQTFSISFRNDALTKKQRERLHCSSDNTKPAHKQRERMNSYDRGGDKARERLPSVDETDKEKEAEKEEEEPSKSQPKESKASSAPKTKEPSAFNLGFLRLGGGGGNHNQTKSKDDDKKKDEKKEDANKKAAATSSTSKKEAETQQQHKGKNPLFFWESRDNSKTADTKKKETTAADVKKANSKADDAKKKDSSKTTEAKKGDTKVDEVKKKGTKSTDAKKADKADDTKKKETKSTTDAEAKKDGSQSDEAKTTDAMPAEAKETEESKPSKSPDKEDGKPKQQDNDETPDEKSEPCPETEAKAEDPPLDTDTNNQANEETSTSADKDKAEQKTTSQEQDEKSKPDAKPKPQEVEKENNKGSTASSSAGKPPLAPRPGVEERSSSSRHFGLPFWRTSPKPVETKSKTETNDKQEDNVDPLL